MLRASHRILKTGGTTAFFVIAVSDEATGAQREEAVVAGPPHVDTDLAYPDLMKAAGFDQVEVLDVTTEYLATLTAWLREWDAAADDLVSIVGEDGFGERQANRFRASKSVGAGYLRRYLVSGIRN